MNLKEREEQGQLTQQTQSVQDSFAGFVLKVQTELELSDMLEVLYSLVLPCCPENIRDWLHEKQFGGKR